MSQSSTVQSSCFQIWHQWSLCLQILSADSCTGDLKAAFTLALQCTVGGLWSFSNTTAFNRSFFLCYISYHSASTHFQYNDNCSQNQSLYCPVSLLIKNLYCYQECEYFWWRQNIKHMWLKQLWIQSNGFQTWVRVFLR